MVTALENFTNLFDIKSSAQSEAYFGMRRHRLDSVTDSVKHLPKLTYVSFLGKAPSKFSIPGLRLIEAALLGDGQVFFSGFTEESSTLTLDLRSTYQPKEISHVSLSLVCNDIPMYQQFLCEAVDHYKTVFEIAGFNLEICVAFYGTNIDSRTKTALNNCRHSIFEEPLSMAEARNNSAALCTGSHIMVTDLDCRLSAHELDKLVSELQNQNDHFGLINFRKPRPTSWNISSYWGYPGNSLYFGDRSVYNKNKYYEKFRGFWYEDTEFLSNFSKLAILPKMVFIDFDYIDHHREHTSRATTNRNFDIFDECLKKGRTDDKV